MTVARLSGDISNLRNPWKELARRTPFSRLPHHIFDPEQTNWIPIAHGKWRFNDHITLGEGRASMVAVEGIVKDVRAHRHIILSLQDNMAWLGASSKGRSTAPAMNFLLRRRASCLCCLRSGSRSPGVSPISSPRMALAACSLREGAQRAQVPPTPRSASGGAHCRVIASRLSQSCPSFGGVVDRDRLRSRV